MSFLIETRSKRRPPYVGQIVEIVGKPRPPPLSLFVCPSGLFIHCRPARIRQRIDPPAARRVMKSASFSIYVAVRRVGRYLMGPSAIDVALNATSHIDRVNLLRMYSFYHRATVTLSDTSFHHVIRGSRPNAKLWARVCVAERSPIPRDINHVSPLYRLIQFAILYTCIKSGIVPNQAQRLLPFRNTDAEYTLSFYQFPPFGQTCSPEGLSRP